MFEPRNGFSEPQTAFVPSRERSGFRSWAPSGAGGETDEWSEPLAGFDAELQSSADAFAQGMAQGEAIERERVSADAAQATAAIAAAAERFEPCCDNMLAGLLAETVARLLSEMFDAEPARPDHLQRRALMLARMVRDEIEPVCLRLHPDDVAMLSDTALPWPIVIDTTLERGEIRLETREGGITDSPAERIERLRRRIAGESGQ